MKVKMISDCWDDILQDKINEYIKHINEKNIIDIKICYCGDRSYTAMIIYKEN